MGEQSQVSPMALVLAEVLCVRVHAANERPGEGEALHTATPLNAAPALHTHIHWAQA